MGEITEKKCKRSNYTQERFCNSREGPKRLTKLMEERQKDKQVKQSGVDCGKEQCQLYQILLSPGYLALVTTNLLGGGRYRLDSRGSGVGHSGEGQQTGLWKRAEPWGSARVSEIQFTCLKGFTHTNFTFFFNWKEAFKGKKKVLLTERNESFWGVC